MDLKSFKMFNELANSFSFEMYFDFIMPKLKLCDVYKLSISDRRYLNEEKLTEIISKAIKWILTYEVLTLIGDRDVK